MTPPVAAPRFSIVTTVFETHPEHLTACLDSVDRQRFGDWEHIVVDDASRSPAVLQILADRESGRRQVIRRAENGGIVAASRDATAAAIGDYLVLLDHDDMLEPTALEAIAQALDGTGGRADLVYTDHDLLDPTGRRRAPVHKPEFSLERLRNHNWITHLVAVRRTTYEALGGFRVGLDGAQDLDLILRVAERGGSIVRVPSIEAHWRQSPASVSSSTSNKAYAFESGRRAVAEHLDRIGQRATVEAGPYDGVYRVRRSIPATTTISVVTVARQAEDRRWGRRRVPVHRALQTVLADRWSGGGIEVVAVVPDTAPPVVESGLRQLATDNVRIVSWTGAHDVAAMWNSALAEAGGDLIMFLDEHAELAAAGSVEALAGLALQDDVGLVGAKILSADGCIANAGYLLHGGVSEMFAGWAGDHPGPLRMLAIERECAAVALTAAVASRGDLELLGGLSPDVGCYRDIDLACRLADLGRRVVWTPHASFHDFGGSGPRSRAESEGLLRSKWNERATVDRFANPNLAPGRGDWLESPN